MKTEKYLGIRPDGSMYWIHVPVHDEPGSISRLHLSDFHEFLQTDCVEMVNVPHLGICLYIDELGKLRDPVLPVNRYLAFTYPGFQHGDPIVGSVIIGCNKPTPPLGELDGFPCDDRLYSMCIGHFVFWGAYPEIKYFGGCCNEASN